MKSEKVSSASWGCAMLFEGSLGFRSSAAVRALDAGRICGVVNRVEYLVNISV